MGFLSSTKILVILAAICTISLFAGLPVEGRVSVARVKSRHKPKYFCNTSEGGSVARSPFPKKFLFGVSSSAGQIEGSANEGGRGPSIWDEMIEKSPEIKDAKDFPRTLDHYKRYKDDIKLIKNLGVDAYRFSISWSRILPKGTLSGGINQEGIDFYNNLIDEILSHGMEPFVTIMHFDLPLALEQEFGGFLNRSMMNYYEDYCELLFEAYGDRVKNWITFNEPNVATTFGYMWGFGPPYSRKCLPPKCVKPVGDKTREPYIVTHNYILAHAAAVKLYRKKFQAMQRGKVGIVLQVSDYKPVTLEHENVAAAQRLLDFHTGWYVEPLVFGHYPQSLKVILKDRLPTFTRKERKMVKGSVDFFGFNYYTSHFAKAEKTTINKSITDIADAHATEPDYDENGNPIGPKDEGSQSIHVYPEGLQSILLFLKKKYNNPKIYITENGIPENRDDSVGLDKALHDPYRIDYIRKHLYHIKAAINNGVKVEGYFYWSVFDNFEWIDGFSKRYGLYYIDFQDNLNRIPKESAKWLHAFLYGHTT